MKRYDLVYSEWMGEGIGVKENGKFVLYEDYAKSEIKWMNIVKNLKKEIETLKNK